MEGFCAGGRQTLDVDGQERSFLVHVPEGLDDEVAPVVHLYHGLGGQADTNLAYTELAAVADDRGFIVVAPQAIESGSRWDYRTSVDEKGSDLAFARELVESAGKEDCVDAEQQFATGISNGSAMIFAMACSGEFPFRAYGGVAAAFYDASCADAPPASIVYFHGTADRVVPFDGGATPLEPVRPVQETMRQWAEHDGCSATAESEQVGEDVEQLTWTGCDDSRLEAFVIEGGGHTWPGAQPIPAIGRTTSTVDASEQMADFFGLGD